VFQRLGAGGNIGFRTTSQFGAGQGVIADASVVPTVNPSGGGILYVEDGATQVSRLEWNDYYYRTRLGSVPVR
jgi:hypothetical protein